MTNCNNDDWIVIKRIKGGKFPETRIDKNGNVFIDGKLYDENDTRYRHFSVNAERHNKISNGEETRKMIEMQKESQEGDIKTVSENRDKNKSESTTVKF
ncbi:hypothetical protein [Dethiobacter alkaliphilus]|uniref:Uncharacterized protein n=1 Tax=Dethiobacter alkaliphilus AHT 1 TaxID=555088 RepID=C0GCN6_DETAL|nr:hypothetical protein [Dethiobacter alkaliphilus]EEG78971.1 hypothetical protein DealDRAFT_0245 [Dethiobacter alkaliphilus AHT 1]